MRSSIENLIFEIASWLVFIPRTLLAVVLRPHRISRHTKAEFAKPRSERFQDRLSPPLFWVIVGVLPTFATVESLRSFTSDPEHASFLEKYVPVDWSNETRVFAITLALVSAPMAFAVATRLLQRKPLTRDSLEPAFYAQCYVFAPFLLFLSASVFLVMVAIVAAMGDALDAIPAVVGAGIGASVEASGEVGDEPIHRAWIDGPWGVALIAACAAITVLWFGFAQGAFFADAFRDGASKLRRLVRATAASGFAVLLCAALFVSWAFGSEAVVGLLATTAQATQHKPALEMPAEPPPPLPPPLPAPEPPTAPSSAVPGHAD